jgi:maltose O-acetyltransferase
MAERSEREKMVSGELYDASDAELDRERVRARRLAGRFNALASEQSPDRWAVLRDLLGTMGEGTWIEGPFQCDYGWNIALGERVFMNFNCVVLDCAPVEIGPLTMFGPAVQLCTATHPVDPVERESGLEYALPISIGRNVWVGAAAIVGPGVTIGDNSVIGAGAVVLRDVPAGVVAVGNPCRVIREL